MISIIVNAENVMFFMRLYCCEFVSRENLINPLLLIELSSSWFFLSLWRAVHVKLVSCVVDSVLALCSIGSQIRCISSVRSCLRIIFQSQ